MNLNLQNIFNTEVITKDKFDKFSKNLSPSLEAIHEKNQGFYKIFNNPSFLNEVDRIESFTKSVKGKFTDIVLCGIGGSALNTRCTDFPIPKECTTATCFRKHWRQVFCFNNCWITS